VFTVTRTFLLLFISVVALSLTACADTDEAAKDLVPEPEAPVVEASGFELFSNAPLARVLRLASYGCRDDAIFVAVGAAEMTGVYKMELAHPELGWRQIYDQEVLMRPTTSALAAALPSGGS